MSIPIITIDGPVASGKGTVARRVAEALEFHLLDSGAIYRALALSAEQKRVDFSDIKALALEAQVLSLEFSGESVLVNGANATAEVRSERIGMLASRVSAIPEVREGLRARQRAFAQLPGLVADGRDMGTVVFTDAALKIYLTATAEVRGARRFGQLQRRKAAIDTSQNSDAKQLIEKGNSHTIGDSLERVVAQIRQRDSQDKSRDTAPLKPAPDAIVIDNALHGPQESVRAVLSLWTLRQS